MRIRLKRVYEPPSKEDGVRVLVDRLWPRGVSKRDAQISYWFKEIAPSDELRKFFGHAPERWEEFRKRYLEELERPEAREQLEELRQLASRGTLTLVFGARDEQHNQAVVLKQVLEQNKRS